MIYLRLFISVILVFISNNFKKVYRSNLCYSSVLQMFRIPFSAFAVIDFLPPHVKVVCSETAEVVGYADGRFKHLAFADLNTDSHS